MQVFNIQRETRSKQDPHQRIIGYSVPKAANNRIVTSSAGIAFGIYSASRKISPRIFSENFVHNDREFLTLVPKVISDPSGHRSSTSMVVFDWQGVTSY